MSTLKFAGGGSRNRRCTELRDAKAQRERRQREGDNNGARGDAGRLEVKKTGAKKSRSDQRKRTKAVEKEMDRSVCG
ncbi:hypothetical protein LXL04_037122 [Taraxacum kok-saghyz]